MNIIIVGSGAVAAELTSYIEDNNKHADADQQQHISGYLDQEENIPKYWAKYKLKMPVLSDAEHYQIQEGDHFIIAISDLVFRKKMIDIIEKKNGKVTGFVHYTSIIADSAVIGEGNIIYPFCIVGPNAVVGKNNLVTGYSFISHDCSVGNNNFFSTAGLSGNVRVGDNNFFGIRSTVLPNIQIGSSNIIQAGMTVDKNIENDSTIFYRFKEKIIAVPKA